MIEPQPNVDELKHRYAEASSAYQAATKEYDDYMHGLPVLMELDALRTKHLWVMCEARDMLLAAVQQEAEEDKARQT